MTYNLRFFQSALKEWQKLDPFVQKQFKARLAKRLVTPHVPSAKLRGYTNLYKIKLRSVGYRLAYLVEEKEISVYVVCVGRRDQIYALLQSRLPTD
ncbi:MAG: type II toxin-antitoxin system RelE/ParE family toxin [Desulfatitalea sp.]|nr:type II toxin-antitoxin system RelE/ParE family toxin [Desulfatitalea sp.]